MSTAPDYTWNHHKSFNTNLSLRTLCVNPNQWGTYLAGVTIYCYKSSNIIVKYRASELFSCFKKVAIWLIPWINNIFNHLVNYFFKLIYLEEFWQNKCPIHSRLNDDSCSLGIIPTYYNKQHKANQHCTTWNMCAVFTFIA